MFQEITTSIFPSSDRFARGAYHAISLIDIDGDGEVEIVMPNKNGPLKILKWGQGRLCEIDVPFLQKLTSLTAIMAADINQDGIEELYCCAAEGTDYLLQYCHGGWQYSDLSATVVGLRKPGQFPYSNGQAVAIDRLGNGQYAFCVAPKAGNLRFYEMSPRGHFLDYASALGMDYYVQDASLLSAPFFTEKSGLFVSVPGAENYLFANKGYGQFSEIAQSAGLKDPMGQNEGASLLCHGRADPAVIVANKDRLAPRFWQMGQGGRYQNHFFDQGASFPETEISDQALIVAVDADLDGCQEWMIFQTGQVPRLYQWGQNGWQQGHAGGLAGFDEDVIAAAVGDVNGDGVPELLLLTRPKNLATGRTMLRIFQASAQSQSQSQSQSNRRKNHFFKCLPLTAVGAPARGAIVTIDVKGHCQKRIIEAGGSCGSVNQAVAHFGLAEHDHIDRLEICWPSGQKYVQKSVRAQQFLTIPYPSTVYA